MTLKINKQIKGGFSLLEMTVVIIIATILASAIIPQLIQGYTVNAANKTALDISAIEEASRAYYISNNGWPASIAALQSGNFLPSSWNAINPFGYSNQNPTIYGYNLALNGTTNGASLIVSTYVPNISAQTIIVNLLPASGINPMTNIVSSGISVPGGANSLQTGTILPWASSNIPIGFLLCDGQVLDITTYQNLYNVIGTAYDVSGDGADGVNTFAIPNLEGKTIFGYQAGDSNFGTLGNSGGSTTMVGDGIYTAGHTDTYNFVNRVKISGGSLYGMTGAQTAQGVSTAVLNPYVTLNYIIKT